MLKGRRFAGDDLGITIGSSWAKAVAMKAETTRRPLRPA
jgi:hypothetical protein